MFKAITKTAKLASIATMLVFSSASLVSAKAERTAYVVVQNLTGKPIFAVNIAHKYSNDFKDALSWPALLQHGASTSPKPVRYYTGFGTTGQDWWSVNWATAGAAGKMHYTDPNNFRGVVDSLELGAQISVPIIAATASAVAGTVCTAGTAGGCGPAAVAGTVAAGAGATALTELMMNNESTEGFKKHVLRSSDSDATTIFKILPGSTKGTVEIISNSGTSKTVWKTTTVTITDEMRSIASAHTPSQSPNQGTAGVTGNNVRVVSFAGGAFEQRGSQWVELQSTGEVAFTFQETGRHAGAVSLYDSNRNVSMQLDLRGNMIMYQGQPLYRITSVAR